MANALCRRILLSTVELDTVHRNVWPAWVMGEHHLFSMLKQITRCWRSWIGWDPWTDYYRTFSSV